MNKPVIIVFLLLIVFAGPLAAQKSIPVLCYHRVKRTVSKNPYILHVKTFERQIRWLKKNGYRTITLDQYHRYLQGENLPLPEKPLLITFDDGPDDFHYISSRVLRRYGFTAVVFINPGNIHKNPGKKRVMTWAMIKKEMKYGHQFQNHGYHHVSFSTMTMKRQLIDLKRAKAAIEKHLGNHVSFFAYPFGSYNRFTRSALARAGYSGAFTVFPGSNDRMTDRWFYTRYMVKGYESFTSFKRYMGKSGLSAHGILPEPGDEVRGGTALVIYLQPGLDTRKIRVQIGRAFSETDKHYKNLLFKYDIKTGRIVSTLPGKLRKYSVIEVSYFSQREASRRILYLKKP